MVLELPLFSWGRTQCPFPPSFVIACLDIGLDNSVVEHLTSDAGAPSSIPSPSINFHLCGIAHIITTSVVSYHANGRTSRNVYRNIQVFFLIQFTVIMLEVK